FRTQTNESEREQRRKLIREELESHFRPEFLNRVDSIVLFDPLDLASVASILECELAKIRERLAKRGIGLELTESAKEELAASGFSERTGARGMRRALEETIEDPLSEMIVLDQVKPGDVARLDYEDGFTFSLHPAEQPA